ncbi:MAG: ATP-binding protein [Candidatus Scalindua sp.]
MMKIETSNYIEREIFSEVAGHLDKPEITLITGSRQVGKTVLMEQLRERLISDKKLSPDSILSYNLDLVHDWEIFQDQSQFIELLKDRSHKRKIYVFVDEAQKVPEASRFFKGVYDSKINAKLILTGSSSLEIKAKFKETLAGRKRIFHLPSFTFFEFLTFREKSMAKYLKRRKKLTRIDQKKLLVLYKEYMTFGGYPRVVLSKSKEEKIDILQEIYSSYIEKDAIGLFEIKNKTAFNRLIKLLSAQIRQLVNIEELSVNLEIVRNTVERYILTLEDTFIIKKISPYFKNPGQEIIKAGKIYFLDLGIRNLALENFISFDEKTDKGLVLENGVFIELFFKLRNKIGALHFWRTKQGAEVDFVIEKGLEVLPVEVKSAIKKETIPTGLRSFIERFHPQKAILVNLSVAEKNIMLNNTKIEFVYPFKINNLN